MYLKGKKRKEEERKETSSLTSSEFITTRPLSTEIYNYL